MHISSLLYRPFPWDQEVSGQHVIWVMIWANSGTCCLKDFSLGNGLLWVATTQQRNGRRRVKGKGINVHHKPRNSLSYHFQGFQVGCKEQASHVVSPGHHIIPLQFCCGSWSDPDSTESRELWTPLLPHLLSEAVQPPLLWQWPIALLPRWQPPAWQPEPGRANKGWGQAKPPCLQGSSQESTSSKPEPSIQFSRKGYVRKSPPMNKKASFIFYLINPPWILCNSFHFYSSHAVTFFLSLH